MENRPEQMKHNKDLIQPSLKIERFVYILGGSCIYSGTLHNLTLAIQIFNKIPFKSYLKFNFGFKTRTLIHRQMPEKLL